MVTETETIAKTITDIVAKTVPYMRMVGPSSSRLSHLINRQLEGLMSNLRWLYSSGMQGLLLRITPSASRSSSKRRREDFSAETPRKRPSRVLRIQLDSDEEEVGDNVEKIFHFRVLLPNGITLELQVPGPPNDMPVQDFVILLRREYQNYEQRTESSPKPKREINWTGKNLHFVDAFEIKIKKMFDFRKLKPNESHMLRRYDGSAEVDKYENMWDLTPDTDLLKELPEEYTFETSLADLIDNSLQAVWSNHADQRRLISVELTENKITIFDTGPGMDGSAENSIIKWGKMGASLHRISKDKGRGGQPSYLTVVSSFQYTVFLAAVKRQLLK
ncbi:hypothetical protein CQW23_07805 [Capsicum baccatum]|uniref:Uncharacterized protein n=1 Tax=Capsicum baccatum TaxID=33114 RepID=A0A2G2X787_CAPBA|nr:hypothetical protein CQW23_07805 [Capsicum baccatum]